MWIFQVKSSSSNLVLVLAPQHLDLGQGGLDYNTKNIEFLLICKMGTYGFFYTITVKNILDYSLII